MAGYSAARRHGLVATIVIAVSLVAVAASLLPGAPTVRAGLTPHQTLIAAGSSATAATTFQLTVPSGVSSTAGYVAVVSVLCSCSGTNAMTSLVDSEHNSYTVHVSKQNADTSNGLMVYIASAQLTTAFTAGDTITATFNTNPTYRAMAAYQFDNFVTPGWFDTSATGNQSTATTTISSAATSTTSQSSETLVAAIGFGNSAATLTSGGGWNDSGSWFTTGTKTKTLAVAAMDVSTTGQYNYAGTLSTADAAVVAVAAFKTTTPNGTATDTPTSTPTSTLTPTPTPTLTPTPTSTLTPTPTPNDPVVMAAGDIACDPTDSSFKSGNGTSTACQEMWTAAELAGTTMVLPLGDNQYNCGTLPQFQQSYDPSWGQQKPITAPAVGNHEYYTTCGNTGGAKGYYTYFGSAASPQDTNCTANCKGYYSYDLGAWHIIALNSECAQVGGCQVGSPQEQWLQADLAAHPAACTLAYWHRPYYTSGWSVGDTELHDIWQDLYNANADLLLNGHDHDYERFRPQDANGNYDPARGIVEIISGTGGQSHGGFNGVVANSVVRDTTTYGVLKLTLHATSYDWQFIPDGHSGSFTDSGSASCH